MKFQPTTLLPLLLLACSQPLAWAGSKEVKSPPPDLVADPAPDLWEVTVTPYGWLAGLDGTNGIAGYTATTDLDFKTILENLDMAAMMQVDVRYDRWLLLLDGQYLRMSADAEPADGILSAAGVEIEQIMFEAALGYRVLAGEQGYLDLFAGARYISVEGEISLDVSSAGVRDVSRDLSREIVNRVTTAVRRETAPALHAAQTALGEHLSDLKASARERLVAEARQRLRDRLEGIIGRPDLPREVVGRGPIRDAIRALVEARAQEAQAEIDAARDAAHAAVAERVQQARARARARARRAVTKAELKLAKELERAITDAIPERVSGKQDWVDPIIGLRGRWNFAGPCYLAGRADIGGFGVGSDLAWQAYAALGFQVSRNATLELGYRHFAIDYTSGGFTYDVAMSGAVIATGISF